MKQSKIRQRIREGWINVIRNLPATGAEELRKTVSELLNAKR